MKSKKIHLGYEEEDLNEKAAIKLSTFFIGMFICIIVITLVFLNKKEIKLTELFSTPNTIYIVSFSLLSFFSGIFLEKLLKDYSKTIRLLATLSFAFYFTFMGGVYQLNDLSQNYYIFLIVGIVIFMINLICFYLNNKYKIIRFRYKMILAGIPITIVLIYAIIMTIWYYNS